ncbi:MAG: transcriptional regulator of [Clostridiales bacterium]|nr:transcriptional regulator of [Clostridiales bacterium]
MNPKIEGINQENVKQSNRSTILKLLSSNGAISRKDIADHIGLTPAAVTLICSELIEEGILIEKGEMTQEKRAGRKKILVDINYSYKRVLCICIEIDETYITITDMAGKIFAQTVIPTNVDMKPEEFLKVVAMESKDLLWSKGVSKDTMLAAGVSVPGTVDRVRGISIRSYRVWNQQVDVKRILEEYLGFDVVVENNVNAYAEGELIYGIGKTTRNLVIVKWGPGVGSAFTINHSVYQGRDFKGAEIGHFIIEKSNVECRCGRKGCLETAISTHAIVDAVKELMIVNDMPLLTEWLDNPEHTLSVHNIREWGRLKDPNLQMIFDEKMDLLARTVENVINMLNPDHVVVYGKIFEVEGLVDRFIRRCMEYDAEISEDYILHSKLSDKISYIGSLAVVMNEYFFWNTK